MCAGSQVNAELWMDAIPTITDLDSYLDQGAIPGGTKRNLASYGKELGPMPERTLSILADPQTSGGLLIAIAPEARSDLESLLVERKQCFGGHLTPR